MTDKERKIIALFLNNEYQVQEIMNIFNLKKCSVCGNIELEEDMVYHKWDLGQVEEQICESCRGDE
jgi:predicted DNA-binding protein YlxM (UPF0122 family)